MAGPITQVFRRFKERRMFFDALVHHPKFKYRTIGAIAGDTGISEERVSELMAEYVQKGLVEKQSSGAYYGFKARLTQQEPPLPNTPCPKLPVPEERDGVMPGSYLDQFGHRSGWRGKSMI